MKKIIRIIRANILTLLLLGMVLCYHLISYRNSAGFNLYEKAQTSFIQLRIGDWTSKKLKFVSFRNLKFGKSYDYVSTKIKEYGYVFKYLIHQHPDFAVLGKSERYQRFYLREEICASYKKEKQGRVKSGIWIAKFVSKMKERGVTVMVVPIPTKISIERDSLPKYLPSCGLWGIFASEKKLLEEDAYGNYKAIIDGSPAHIIDLYKNYKDYLKIHPEDYVFVPSDSHWSSLGISLAAKDVVDHLRTLGWSIGSSSMKQKSSTPIQGEFIYYLQIPQFYVQQSKNLQWTEPLYSLEVSLKSKKNVQTGRVIVFGTSYSERLKESKWGLGNLISKALRREVIDVSYHAAGPIGSFTKFKQAGYKLRRGDLLIWEFPTRYTPTEYDSIPDFDFEDEGQVPMRLESTVSRKLQYPSAANLPKKTDRGYSQRY